jgi:hypothetical protein
MSLKRDLLAVILLVGLEPPTQAHDIYSHLRDRLGGSCCDEKDCRPAPYRVAATGVRMFVDGEWIVVPDFTIQYRALLGDTGETAGGHWCGFIRDGYGDRVEYSTLCAVLPPNPTAIVGPPFALREGHLRPVP